MKNFLVKIQNFINTNINKYGVDKVLHFLAAAFLTSLVSPMGIAAMLTMFVFLMIVSYIKEKYMDYEFSKDDIKFALYGCITSFILYTPIWILNMLLK